MTSLYNIVDVLHFLENHFNLKIKTFESRSLKFEFSFTFERKFILWNQSRLQNNRNWVFYVFMMERSMKMNIDGKEWLVHGKKVWQSTRKGEKLTVTKKQNREALEIDPYAFT